MVMLGSLEGDRITAVVVSTMLVESTTMVVMAQDLDPQLRDLTTEPLLIVGPGNLSSLLLRDIHANTATVSVRILLKLVGLLRFEAVLLSAATSTLFRLRATTRRKTGTLAAGFLPVRQWAHLVG